MNLVFKYERKKCKNKFLYAYFNKLALYNKKLIMKYCHMVDVEEVYSRCCVCKLPLKYEYGQKCLRCQHTLILSFEDLKFDSKAYKKCMYCWADILESPDKYLDYTIDLPPFLAQKKQQKKRPERIKYKLLTTKKPPSCLEKRNQR